MSHRRSVMRRNFPKLLRQASGGLRGAERQLRAIAAQVTPVEARRAMDEIDELRESEAYID